MARSPLSSRDPSEEDLPDDDAPKKPFDIERKRLGLITRYINDKEYGFIDAEDFRDDVFFHRDSFEPMQIGRNEETGQPVGLTPVEGLWIEFEIDEDYLREKDKMRAKSVRPTKRPGGKKLSGKDATFQIVTHHRNARRKKPNWR